MDSYDPSELVLRNVSLSAVGRHQAAFGGGYWFGSDLQLKNANAVVRTVYAMDISFRFFLPLQYALFLMIALTVAWLVAEDAPNAGRARRSGRARRCLATCCVTAKAGLLSTDSRKQKAAGAESRRLVSTAQKVVDVCKTISVLYLFLSTGSMTNMLCDTPSALAVKNGWGVTTLVPSFLGGGRVFAPHWREHMGYTLEEYHAVVALMSASPNMYTFWVLLAAEVVGFTVSLTTWGALRRHTWTAVYAGISFLVAIVWSVYEGEMYSLVTLQDNGEEFFCFVPYLNVVSRSMSFLHLLIAGFYLGLALGSGSMLASCRLCCPRCCCADAPQPTERKAAFAAGAPLTPLQGRNPRLPVVLAGGAYLASASRQRFPALAGPPVGLRGGAGAGAGSTAPAGRPGGGGGANPMLQASASAARGP